MERLLEQFVNIAPDALLVSDREGIIQDARNAIDAKDITPILKWVKLQDEKAVKAAFNKVLTSKSKNQEETEHEFFATLVKIHRAGEGASFTENATKSRITPNTDNATVVCS